ncbi:MAG: YkgJ family cysteine cluster protein [Fimbriiglobus sp.]
MPKLPMIDDRTPENVWYKDGLPFSCTQCGKCCTGEPGYVWLSEDEITALAKFRGEKENEFLALHTKRAKGRVTLREKPNGDCVFYDAKKGCTVYSVRPIQCRTWPFWDSNLETPADWERTVAICPGSGEGEIIPVEEILVRTRGISM